MPPDRTGYWRYDSSVRAAASVCAPPGNGPDSFTYRTSDGSLQSGVATVNLTVNAVNDPPVANVVAGGTCSRSPHGHDHGQEARHGERDDHGH
jgi:hypothetical protein